MSPKASLEFAAHDQLWIAECPQTTHYRAFTARLVGMDFSHRRLHLRCVIQERMHASVRDRERDAWRWRAWPS